MLQFYAANEKLECCKVINTVAYLRHARDVTSKHAPRLRNSRQSGVFSVSGHDESRIASPCLLPGISYKHLDDAKVGKCHVIVPAVMSRVSTVMQQLKHSRMSDQGFIGDTEASSGGVISEF
jgi:hypothetical protein